LQAFIYQTDDGIGGATTLTQGDTKHSHATISQEAGMLRRENAGPPPKDMGRGCFELARDSD